MGNKFSHIIDTLHPILSEERIGQLRGLLADHDVSTKKQIGRVLTGTAVLWPHRRIKISRAHRFSSTTR